MDKKIGMLVKKLAVLWAPAVLLLLVHLLMQDRFNLALLVGVHLVTIPWVALIYRKQLCRPTLLPLSFLIAPWLCYFVESGRTAYMRIQLLSIFYSIPWAILTFGIALVLFIREKRKKRKQVALYECRDETEG